MDINCPECKKINSLKLKGKHINQYYCPECLWFHDEYNVGMKSTCPRCRHYLHIIGGTKKELVLFKKLKLGELQLDDLNKPKEIV